MHARQTRRVSPLEFDKSLFGAHQHQGLGNPRAKALRREVKVRGEKRKNVTGFKKFAYLASTPLSHVQVMPRAWSELKYLFMSLAGFCSK